jgi:NAD(P)-dependent dehydrogenase (short-subunit alcohol dehydrogenase family)
MPTPERFAIKPGLRVLVTAGAAGIGQAIASTFAGAGARVHICDISQAVLDECLAAAPDISGTLADVSDEHDVARLFAEVGRQLSGLDVLVNNAGIAGPTGGIHEISPADWRRTIDVNLTGQFYCARLAVPMLREASDGAIINMASVAGRLGYAFRTPYAAAKWGIIGLTESLAKELGPEGIRVNAILPGIVAGPRMTRVIQARADAAQVDYATMESEFLGKVSLRRMVTAQDVADMVLFLCSPAGRNISGQSLSVCGNVETL